MSSKNRFAALMSDDSSESEKETNNKNNSNEQKSIILNTEIKENKIVVGTGLASSSASRKRPREESAEESEDDADETVIQNKKNESEDEDNEEEESSDNKKDINDDEDDEEDNKKIRIDDKKEDTIQNSEKTTNVGTSRGGVRWDVLHTITEDVPIAKKGKVAKVRYEGFLTNKGNKRFDKGTIDWVVGAGDMIQGFELGILGMKVGERRKIYVPAKLGYGKKGAKPKIPPNSDLMFDVSLLESGVCWEIKKENNMSNKRREAAKRRGKKPRTN